MRTARKVMPSTPVRRPSKQSPQFSAELITPSRMANWRAQPPARPNRLSASVTAPPYSR